MAPELDPMLNPLLLGRFPLIEVPAVILSLDGSTPDTYTR